MSEPENRIPEAHLAVLDNELKRLHSLMKDPKVPEDIRKWAATQSESIVNDLRNTKPAS